MNAEFEIKQKVIETKRIKLRPFNENDLDDFYEYAKVEETEDGFIYTALLDYESGYRLPNSVNDYNYYSADSEAKIIHYAQSGKGFDCK